MVNNVSRSRSIDERRNPSPSSEHMAGYLLLLTSYIHHTNRSMHGGYNVWMNRIWMTAWHMTVWHMAVWHMTPWHHDTMPTWHMPPWHLTAWHMTAWHIITWHMAAGHMIKYFTQHYFIILEAHYFSGIFSPAASVLSSYHFEVVWHLAWIWQ